MKIKWRKIHQNSIINNSKLCKGSCLDPKIVIRKNIMIEKNINHNSKVQILGLKNLRMKTHYLKPMMKKLPALPS